MNILKSPYTGLLFNFVYGLVNCCVGFFSHSLWLLIVGAYDIILAVTRFSVLQMQRKSQGNRQSAQFVRRTTGFLLIALSFCLIGINVLSAVETHDTAYHEILMIAIAAHTFFKFTLANVHLAKIKWSSSPFSQTLCSISFAEALASVYALQRSMLVSFPGMAPDEIRLFNILTGTGVWILIFSLGIILTVRRWEHGKKQNCKGKRKDC